jgi:hypothetical protein
MNTMYRCALAALVAVSITAPAAAQLQRAFPQGTLRGAMTFGDYPQVTLNGRGTQLSPGSRIRDGQNMIVMAGSLAGARMLVHYTLDIGGEQVRDVWILRPDEAAIKPWPGTPDEARLWMFDATTQTWVRP